MSARVWKYFRRWKTRNIVQTGAGRYAGSGRSAARTGGGLTHGVPQLERRDGSIAHGLPAQRRGGCRERALQPEEKDGPARRPNRHHLMHTIMIWAVTASRPLQHPDRYSITGLRTSLVWLSACIGLAAGPSRAARVYKTDISQANTDKSQSKTDLSQCGGGGGLTVSPSERETESMHSTVDRRRSSCGGEHPGTPADRVTPATNEGCTRSIRISGQCLSNGEGHGWYNIGDVRWVIRSA